jgi:subtilisin family serine protease
MKKILLALSVFAGLASKAQNVYRDFVDGQIYVQFSAGSLKQVAKDDPRNIDFSKISSVQSILKKYGVQKASKPFYMADDDARLPYIVKFEFTQKTKVADLIGELEKVSGIAYAEKVPAMTTFTTPNDPNYGLQAHLPQINAPNAWNVFNGNSNVLLAIVDNAVQWTHTDLVANVYTNTAEASGVAGVDDDGNGYVDDINGYDVGDNDNDPLPPNNTFDHGTHTSGIAAARTNNAVGVAGIGWNIRLLPVKCTMNTSPATQVDNGYGGIIYAAKSGARVISCSWGGAGGGAAGQTVIDYAWSKGSIVVAAAGNSNVNTPNYPGAYNNVYCVASCNGSNVKSSFSNYGNWVDITAPGENIYSTVPTNSYNYMSGTSMATPLVAGLCALMLSKCPLMTQTNVLNCISSTAVNIYSIGANATYSPGLQLGAGRIEAFAAMNCAASFSAAPPIANFYTLTRTVCPNVPVVFKDSSLYLYTPASWSWTFQAGTPATSTSSNPTVQWTTPGTYSVGLTVTTPNGNNPKTRTAYISIVTPTTLPLNEGFQAATFLPVNWTSYNVGNDNIYWSRANFCGGFGTSTACATFDNYDLDASGDRDEMRTPRYDFTSVASAHLRFDVAYKEFDNVYSDTLRVKLSNNCGSTWSYFYTKGGSVLSTNPGTLQANTFTPTAGQWRTDSIDITAFSAGQANIMASFENHGRYGQALYLDNINLFFPAPVANFNTPPPVCAGTSVSFTNTTTGATSYTWNFPGASPATSTLTNPSTTYTSGGIFTASLTALNGTTTITVTKTLSINGIPTVAVNNQTICSGGTATLNATGAQTYSWSTGFVGNPLLVTPPTNTVYSVTGNSLGCISSTTVSVTIGSQLSVFITPSQPSVCAGGTSTLTASGAVSYTWNNNSNATAIVVTPTSSTTYSIIGSNGACTGTTLLTVTVVPTPTISVSTVPSQTICLGKTATLTANGSYTNYTWVTPTVNASSVTVSPSVNTSYTVYASAAGGCNTSSVVNMVIKPVPNAATTTTNASCQGCPDGIAEVVASGGVGPYTYQWLPVGGTQSVVNGFTDGCYTVVVTGANSCSTSTTACVGFDITTGLKSNSIGSNLLIYPNPASAYVTIEYNGVIFNCSMYNNLGQLVIEKNVNQNSAFISTGELAKGVYTIVIEQGKEKFRRKLVIQ